MIRQDGRSPKHSMLYPSDRVSIRWNRADVRTNIRAEFPHAVLASTKDEQYIGSPIIEPKTRNVFELFLGQHLPVLSADLSTNMFFGPVIAGKGLQFNCGQRELKSFEVSI